MGLQGVFLRLLDLNQVGREAANLPRIRLRFSPLRSPPRLPPHSGALRGDHHRPASSLIPAKGRAGRSASHVASLLSMHTLTLCSAPLPRPGYRLTREPCGSDHHRPRMLPHSRLRRGGFAPLRTSLRSSPYSLLGGARGHPLKVSLPLALPPPSFNPPCPDGLNRKILCEGAGHRQGGSLYASPKGEAGPIIRFLSLRPLSRLPRFA